MPQHDVAQRLSFLGQYAQPTGSDFFHGNHCGCTRYSVLFNNTLDFHHLQL